MAVLHPPDSAYAKEMTKWEAQGSILGPGLRPYVHRDYPMMVHLAAALSKGGVGIVERKIVDGPDARARAEQDGFRATPLEAIAALEEQQTEFGKLAAERAFEVRRMSAKAQAEVVQAEADAGAQHLPTIAEKPKRKYVRKHSPTGKES